MDRKVFEQGCTVLVKTFQDKQFDVNIMWEFLKDLSNYQFITAIKKLVLTAREIYKSTNIVALIRELALLAPKKSAGEAWLEVLKEVSYTGSWGQPRPFSSSLIRQAVDIIGWKTICMSETIAIERAHFFKVYDTLVDRHKTTVITQGQLPEEKQEKIEINPEAQAQIAELVKMTTER